MKNCYDIARYPLGEPMGSNGDKKFRLALVALESGKCGLTETGHIVERDDSACLTNRGACALQLVGKQTSWGRR